jgi:hypothetical protein
MFTAPSIYDNYTPVAFVVAMLVIKLYWVPNDDTACRQTRDV